MSFIQRRSVGIVVTLVACVVWVSPADAQCCGSGGRSMRMPGFPAQLPFLPQLALQTPLPQPSLLLQQQVLLQQQMLLQQQLLLQRQPQELLTLQDLLRRLSTQSESRVKESLTSDATLERLAGSIIVGMRSLPLHDDLIKLVEDPAEAVRQAARRSLIALSTREAQRASSTSSSSAKSTRAVDFGPAPNASKKAQKTASKKWSNWWDQRALVASK